MYVILGSYALSDLQQLSCIGLDAGSCSKQDPPAETSNLAPTHALTCTQPLS